MLVDVHAHFHHPAGNRIDWADRNESRLAAGEMIGVMWHVASILGSWGRTSPTYFPSPNDVRAGNDALVELMQLHPRRIKGYVCVNPNFTDQALAEIERCVALGMIGIKLAASRRADDPLLDPIGELAAHRGLPVLHHIWQHRRHDWPGQEASDAVELGQLAKRHPTVPFILAHLGGGGDWLHTLRAVKMIDNIFVDLSGSGVDTGMLEGAIAAVGSSRLLWGADLTLCTGLAKLRYLETILTGSELDAVRWENAERIFPPGVFGAAL